MTSILVVNAGSSSVKFQVFALRGGALDRLIKGQIDGVGSTPRLRAAGEGGTLADQSYDAAAVPDVAAALRTAGDWLRTSQKIDPVAIGHRVVHGGPDFSAPVRVTPEVLAHLMTYVPLAPLHQPHNLAPIRSVMDRYPELPQVACFDTAFHRSHGALADHYAIPRRYYDQGIRRYGFHGLSYEFIADRLKTVAPEVAMGRVIVAHLGSGASMCAMSGGRSVESTMGYTALDGLPMGTRPGQIDPGIVLHLIAQERMPADQVQDMLYKECGLKGLSGISNDVRQLLASKDPNAAFALEYFCYRIALSAGMLAAALGGVDAFVFTAGVGENAAPVRANVMSRLAWLGLKLDPGRNAGNETCISAPGSSVPAYIIPTDEELMIARHTARLLTL
jgi:acetate kinase